jgi:hypothetical protein
MKGTTEHVKFYTSLYKISHVHLFSLCIAIKLKDDVWIAHAHNIVTLHNCTHKELSIQFCM